MRSGSRRGTGNLAPLAVSLTSGSYWGDKALRIPLPITPWVLTALTRDWVGAARRFPVVWWSMGFAFSDTKIGKGNIHVLTRQRP